VCDKEHLKKKSKKVGNVDPKWKENTYVIPTQQFKVLFLKVGYLFNFKDKKKREQKRWKRIDSK